MQQAQALPRASFPKSSNPPHPASPSSHSRSGVRRRHIAPSSDPSCISPLPTRLARCSRRPCGSSAHPTHALEPSAQRSGTTAQRTRRQPPFRHRNRVPDAYSVSITPRRKSSERRRQAEACAPGEGGACMIALSPPAPSGRPRMQPRAWAIHAGGHHHLMKGACVEPHACKPFAPSRAAA